MTARAHPIALGVACLVMTAAGCADGDPHATDPCAVERCANAPPPECQGTLKIVYQALGTCSADATGTATCTYPVAQRQDCRDLDGKVCEAGACVAVPVVKCDGVVCATPPAPDCDGTSGRIFGQAGTCDPDRGAAGECVYPVTDTIDCAARGLACRDGGCVDPAEHPCDPNPCDVPPQGTCAGNVPTAPAATGTCTEVGDDPAASCAYPTAPQAACTGATASCWLGRCAGALRAPRAGDVVIDEVMKNPTRAGDDAEWLELANVADDALQLDGCTLTDDDGERFTFGADVIVPARGFFVIGSNPDPGANGGFAPDLVAPDLVLANEADELELTCGGALIDRVAWTASWPARTGRAMNLGGTPSAAANDAAGAWCDAPTRFGDGTNLGSPRRANPACSP